MGRGKIWHPAPRGLVVDAAVGNWSRQNPAPDLVVYLWIWSQRDDGENPTRRRVARLFGWSEHYARQMVDRVRTEHREWVEEFSPTTGEGSRPSTSSNLGYLRNQITQESPANIRNSPDRARGSTRNSNQIKPITELIQEVGKWQRD